MTYNCYANYGLTSSLSDTDITVSFTSTPLDFSTLGHVSLWATDPYGEPYQIEDMTDTATVNFGFLYVYPSVIEGFMESNDTADPGDLDPYILKTTVHKFGHVLGLAHPVSTESFVMQSGLLTLTVPTNYDKLDLHNQWCD